MRTARTERDRLRSKGFAGAAVLLLGASAGCGGGASVAAAGAAASKTTPAPASAVASNAAGATNAATATSAAAAAVTVSAAVRTTVKATGGGDFCKAIAAAVNKQSAAGTSSQEIASRVATVRKEEEQAVGLAPSSIKADVVRVLAASDAVWSALAKVNYDYSQLKASDMSALSSPETAAAEGRLTAYMTGTCGLSAAPPPARPSH
ncbi:MAG: hypothetical protein QOJ11_518 [Frankiales bacterium]|jgi:hypothetical protein|nr:hypothetical protein [Frankiales bacterium]